MKSTDKTVKPQVPSSTSSTGDEPDWFATYDQKKAEKEALQQLKEEVKRKEKREAKLQKVREEYSRSKWQAKRKV